jgi:hypothetical protein
LFVWGYSKMSYGHKDLCVKTLVADTILVSRQSPYFGLHAGHENLMEYIQRLERRILYLEKQNKDRSIWEIENEINIKASGRSSEASAPPPDGLAKQQENEMIQVEGAVPETS